MRTYLPLGLLLLELVELLLLLGPLFAPFCNVLLQLLIELCVLLLLPLLQGPHTGQLAVTRRIISRYITQLHCNENETGFDSHLQSGDIIECNFVTNSNIIDCCSEEHIEHNETNKSS